MEEMASTFLAEIPFDGKGAKKGMDICKTESSSPDHSPPSQMSCSAPSRSSMSKSKSRSQAISCSYSNRSGSCSANDSRRPFSIETALKIKRGSSGNKKSTEDTANKHSHHSHRSHRHHNHHHHHSSKRHHAGAKHKEGEEKEKKEKEEEEEKDLPETEKMAMCFLTSLSVNEDKSTEKGDDNPDLGHNDNSYYYYHNYHNDEGDGYRHQNSPGCSGTECSESCSCGDYGGGTTDRGSYVTDSERTDDSRKDPRKSSYVNTQSFCSEDGSVHRGRCPVYCVGEAGFRKKQDKWNRQRPKQTMYIVSFYHSQFITCSSYIEDDIASKSVTKDDLFPDPLFSFAESKLLTSRSFGSCVEPTWTLASEKRTYGPEDMVDNPYLKLGYKRSVFAYPSFVCSILPYIDSKDIRTELNDQFAYLHPDVCSGGVTLTKLRRIKGKILPLCVKTLETSTVALCYCLIDRLLRTGKVTKKNLRLSIAICLFLSVKQNEDKSTNGIIALRKEIAKTVGVSSRKILEHEFQ